MKVARTAGAVMLLIVAAASVHAFAGAGAQGAAQAPATPVAKLVAEPSSLTVRAGEAVALKVTAYDAAGKPIPDAVVRVNLPRRSGIYADGKVTGFLAGSIVATAVAAGGAGTPVTLEIPITISWPALASLQITPEPGVSTRASPSRTSRPASTPTAANGRA